MIGSLFAQLIGLVFYPLITRIYTPEEFGIFSLVSSTVSLILVISALRYEQAIMLPDDERDAASILLLSLIILCCTSGLSLPIFMCGGNIIATILNSPLISAYLIIVPIGVFCQGLYIIFRMWGVREKQFGVQAITQATQSGTASCLKFGLGTIFSPGAWGLLIGQYIGEIIGTLYLLYNILRFDLKRIRLGASLQRIKHVASRYKKFPLFDSSSAFLEKLSTILPVYLLTLFFSTTVTGYYSLGYHMLQLPIGLIAMSIRYVFFQHAVEARNAGNLNTILQDIVTCLVLIATLPFLTLIFIGNDLFSIVFGSAWSEAGVYVQILAIWSLFWFITSALQVMIPVLEIQKFGLKFNLLNFGVQLMVLCIGGVLANIYLTLGLMAISGTLINAYLIHNILKRVEVKIKDVLVQIWKELVLSLFLLMGLFLLQLINANSLLICGSAIIIIISYFLIVLRRNNVLRTYVFGK